MDTVLEAVRRDRFGSNDVGRLRREGQIPAVLYGGKVEKAESVAVNPKALMQILLSDSGVNTIIGLKLDGAENTPVLIKEFQLHPVSHDLLHADFYRVAMDQVLEVMVPIRLTGEPVGVKVDGGVVDFVHRELEIECLPGDIPEQVTIDISELTLNQGVRVRELETGGKWKALSEPEMLIVHVVPPRVEAEAEAEEEEAAAAAAGEAAEGEPEVIKKGKEDDEGDDKSKKD